MNPNPGPYDAAIEDVEARIRDLQKTLETLMQLRSQSEGLPFAGAARQTASATDLPHDSFFQMTVPDAAEKYLALSKKTKSNAEVAESLLKGGLKSSAKNFPQMIRTVLSRENRFVRVNGEWGLAIWYPGMRRGPRAVPDAQAEPRQVRETKVFKASSEAKGFGPNSLKGRIFHLLDANPKEIFDAVTIAAKLSASKPSVSAGLAGLFADGFVLRPERSKYKSKKTA